MRTLALAGLLLAIGLIAGILMWRSAPEPEPVTLTVGTGHSGGVYYTYGLGLEEATAGTATPVQTRSTPASVANLRMVHTGQLDAGFTMADVAALAVNGEAPFSEVQDIRAVARLYDNRSEEHTSELQSRGHLVCRLLLEKKKKDQYGHPKHSNI